MGVDSHWFCSAMGNVSKFCHEGSHWEMGMELKSNAFSPVERAMIIAIKSLVSRKYIDRFFGCSVSLSLILLHSEHWYAWGDYKSCKLGFSL